MKLQKFSLSLQELTFEQASEVNGGESFWYWPAYIVGGIIHGIVNDIKAASNGTYTQSAGSATMHSALG
jgi:hypothetical protein